MNEAPQLSWRAWLSQIRAREGLLLAAAAFVVLAGVFALGEWRGRENAFEGAGSEQQMRARLQSIEEENREAAEQIARLQTDARIDRETYAQVEEQLADLQGKIIEQQEELAFYRGIVGGPGKGSLRIQDFSLVARPPAAVRLHLVLARVEGGGQHVRGEVQVRIEGLRAGRVVSMDVSSLSAGAGAKPMTFNFRYFQDMEADIQVPAGFTPQRVVVRIVPRTGGIRPSVESFPWTLKRS